MITLRCYSLKHNQTDKLFSLMLAYRNVINSIITDIWNIIEWKKKSINGKQIRIIPYYEKSRELRAELRNKYIQEWEFASHWIDSALKTAISIIDSWKKEERKANSKKIVP